MDSQKIIQQYPLVRHKTMSDLINDKHNKNLKKLMSLEKKWMSKEVHKKNS